MRLLINADALWPAPAPLHRTAKPKALSKLVDAGIVDLLPRDRYRIHGLDAERGRRRDAARTPPKRDPDGPQTGTVRLANGSPARALAETRRDETSQAEPSNARDEPHIEAWLIARHRLPTERQQAFLDRYLQVFDVTGPERMAKIILEHPDDPIAFLKEDLDKHREERLNGLGTYTPKPRPKAKREPWQDLLRDKLAADEAALLERTHLPGDAA